MIIENLSGVVVPLGRSWVGVVGGSLDDMEWGSLLKGDRDEGVSEGVGVNLGRVQSGALG